MDLIATIECKVYAGLSLAATIECEVGNPYQADIRNLATDRWYQMYPDDGRTLAGDRWYQAYPS